MNIGQQIYSTQFDLKNPAVRRHIVKRGGFLGWCLVYLRHYFSVEPADFHFLLAQALENPQDDLLEIIGFRGSAKSTFASLGLPLYLALEHIYDFIIPVGDTTTQSKLNIANMRYELEHNEYIREDYGVTFNPDKSWSDDRLQLLSGVLILSRSRGQKMRGLRHRQFRPQVVICDDLEDLQWVQKKVNRDKTERWFNSEVIPAQQEDKSKLIVIGNLLHKDALMMRLKKRRKANGKRLFLCLEFPLIHKVTKRVMWRGKYPTRAALQKQKEKVGRVAWAREYLLKIIAEEDQVIKETDIHYYLNAILDKRHEETGKKFHVPKDSGTGVDLAISEKQTADFTAMVGGLKITLDSKDRILILPNPVNKRMGYDATLKEAVRVNATMPYGNKWYVEAVNYQRAAVQGMKRKGLTVYEMSAISDKKARLETISPFVIDGTILFAAKGCEELIDQIIGFGTEEHDDLVDAFVYLIMGLIKRRSFKAADRPDKI